MERINYGDNDGYCDNDAVDGGNHDKIYTAAYKVDVGGNYQVAADALTLAP